MVLSDEAESNLLEEASSFTGTKLIYGIVVYPITKGLLESLIGDLFGWIGAAFARPLRGNNPIIPFVALHYYLCADSETFYIIGLGMQPFGDGSPRVKQIGIKVPRRGVISMMVESVPGLTKWLDVTLEDAGEVTYNFQIKFYQSERLEKFRSMLNL